MISNGYEENHGYRFGDYVLDIDRGALLCNENELKLRPKSFEVLRYLVERPGKLVSRQKLFDAVWGGAVVTDDALTQCLMDIRKALGDSEQAVIKTVPRRGYLFEAPVEPLETQAPNELEVPDGQRRWVWWAAVAATIIALGFGLRLAETPSDFTDTPAPSLATDRPSIAIIPLVNMSSHEENVFFAGGIHEDVLTNLAQIEGLHVVSRTSMLKFAASAMSLKELSNELGVDYIVEGSVRRIGNHVRVTIQLIDAHNDRNLWANNYERELVDVFATQSRLAREISDSIRLELQPDSVGELEGMPTNSVKAFDLYVRAENIEKVEGETESSMVRRRAMLEEAVEEDPGFVEAWAVLKRVYDLQRARVGPHGWYVADGEDSDALAADLKAKAQRALDKAIALDPDNVETLLSSVVDHDWPKTEEEMQAQKVVFDQIVAEHPEHAKTWYHLGWWHTRMSDIPAHNRTAIEADAIAAFEVALKVDPFNARTVGAVLTWYRHRGYQDDVTRLSARFQQIVPETANDRSLARVSWAFKKKQLISAFLATADESLLSGYAKGLAKAVGKGSYKVPVSRFLDETELAILTADYDGFSAHASMQVDLNQSNYHYVAFTLLKSTGIKMLVDAGNMDEAHQLARRILEQEEAILTQWLNTCVCNFHDLAHSHDMIGPGALAQAHALLGNTDASAELYAKLIEEKSLSRVTRIRILAHIDIAQAVDVAFEELENNPNWNGFDLMAAYYLFNSEILAHPRVQAYYQKQSKWVDYLSARMPQYYTPRESI